MWFMVSDWLQLAGFEFMRRSWYWSIAVLIAVPVAGWSAEQDCALSARYYQLAATARSEYREQDAYEFLVRAADTCRTYQYVQEMAEFATQFGDPELDLRAAEVFGEALELAGNDSERARSIARYAELLFHGNDPQNAMSYIVEARNLDSDSVWIAELSDQITTRAANVTPEDIKRGLGDMAFKPLRLRRSINDDELALIGNSGGAGGGEQISQRPSPAVTLPARKSINIPLNFQVNSTALDVATQNNLRVLAETLVQDEFADKHFLLIGHADTRGDASANLVLSAQRATAIFAAIQVLQPGLANRIQTAGKGEEQPLSTGMSEADHRINRRLEVVLIDE
ncbi:MAG: OmpA family protein [Gammaproteobacteria bacterium]|nr:OmpA family protein [Gammaproteobacteria bacterium]